MHNFTAKERDDIAKLTPDSRANAVQEQLKRIRESCANAGSVDASTINDALDRLELLTEKKPDKLDKAAAFKPAQEPAQSSA